MEKETKVLIVEDDLDINRLIAYNLSKEGFSVEQVFDGWEALKKIKQQNFDIVVLDIMLPCIDGFTVCKEIKNIARPSRTFVLMISVKNSDQDKLYAHILGADCYLTKPFSIEVLVNSVKELSSMINRDFLVKAK